MNHNDTLGRRIQACRKAIGLSQEALGEQLQVSRQAVSKWESDITIPELDSLIAMSRIFGVSIGALLGVEPAGTANAEQPDAADEAAKQAAETDTNASGLTEKELAAVEAIAARYAREAEQHRKFRWSKKRIIAAVVAGVLVLSGVYVVQRQIQKMESQFRQLQLRVSEIDSGVASRFSLMTNQIENILEETANILSDYRFSITGFDPKRETVTLELSATPKEWTVGTTAQFNLVTQEGEQVLSDVLEGNNGVFTAKGLVVPMSREINLSVTFLDGEAARTEKLEPIYDCVPSSFQLKVQGHWGSSWSNPGTTVTMTGVGINIDAPWIDGYGSVVAPAKAELCLFRNRELVPEQVIRLPVDREKFAGYSYWEIYSNYETAGPLQEGSTGEAEMEGYSPMDDTVCIHLKANTCAIRFELAGDDTMAEVLRLTDSEGQVTYALLSAHRCRDGYIVGSDLDSDFPWEPGTAITE